MDTRSMPGHALSIFWVDWDIYKQMACVPAGEAAMVLYLACDEALQFTVCTAVTSLSGLTEDDLVTLISMLVKQHLNPAAARKIFPLTNPIAR